ncbi:uncharacterized protein [Prorops nasuta]|uniref:uncharacterized protein n=1 Tax=Prorops nasuta TaxID=863751 RepID=UPI0034CD6273
MIVDKADGRFKIYTFNVRVRILKTMNNIKKSKTKIAGTKDGVLRILQINLNTCSKAQAIMEQYIFEKSCDIVLITEQARNITLNNWIASTLNNCAILLVSQRVPPILSSFATDGFCVYELPLLWIVSTYITPNCNLTYFQAYLDKLSDFLYKTNKPVLIGGDFNSHSYAWGSNKENRRGCLLKDFFLKHDLILCNQGSSPTYQRFNAESILDLTLISCRLLDRIKNWSVSRDYSGSDHNYILFDLLTEDASVAF